MSGPQVVETGGLIVSPRVALLVSAFLAAVLLLTLLTACIRPVQPGVYIEDCALVLTRSGQECR